MTVNKDVVKAAEIDDVISEKVMNELSDYYMDKNAEAYNELAG